MIYHHQVQKDGSMGGWTSLNSHTLIDDVIIDDVKCSITSMELFDKLYNTQSSTNIINIIIIIELLFRRCGKREWRHCQVF
jgi:hypothetical protein